MAPPRAPSQQSFGTTTLGACALCNRATPRGSGWMLAGAAAFGVGLTAAVVAYYRQGLEGISGQACAVAMAVGGALLVTGLMRGVKSSNRTFAFGRLLLPEGWRHAGDTFELAVMVTPDHTLHLLDSRLELQAVEAVDENETVLRSREIDLPLPATLRERTTVNVKVSIPVDWPVDMRSPEGAVPRKTVSSRLRVLVDTEAHPVLQIEAPVRVAAGTS